MRTVIATASTIVLLLVGQAVAEPPPETSAFLREVGIDPKSSPVTTVEKDLVGNYSLDLLAKRRNEDGIKDFIVTRNFLRLLRSNPNAEFPNQYDPRYLSEDERKFVGNISVQRALENISRGKK